MLTLKELLKAPKKNYMNKQQLAFFKQHLLTLKEKTQEHINQLRAELSQEGNEADTLDQAALEDERHIKLRIIERESKLLPKIDAAIQRIHNGTYGYCEETGNQIGIQRLLARPTATLSTEAKEAQETKEKHYSD